MVFGSFRVRMRGLGELRNYFTRVKAKTPKEAKKLTKRLAKIVRKGARKRVAPFRTGTGDLKRSIEIIPVGRTGHTVRAGIGLNRPYAAMQEEGFQAHWIHRSMVRSGARMLGKKNQFFKVQRWTPYLEPAFRDALARLDSEMNRTANEILRG